MNGSEIMYTFTFWAPLSNFSSELDNIDLSPSARIKKINADQTKMLNTLADKWPTVSRSEYLLEYKLVSKRPEKSPREYLEDGRIVVEKAVTIFRLYRSNIIGFNAVVQPLSDNENAALSATHYKHYQLWSVPDKLYKDKYVIKDHESDEVAEFYRHYEKKDLSAIEMAIFYFNKSYMEPYPLRDSFLDLMIALENMYLKNEAQELGYKLRMRMAYVLSDKYEMRREIYQDMKKAYTYRSKIVHGEKYEKFSYDYLFKIRDYTRRSILKFLEIPKLSDELDHIILRGAD